MKKIIAVAVAATTLAIPAVASASSTSGITAFVKQGYSTQLRNRARLAGYTVVGVNVRCLSDGGSYYSCYATYTLRQYGDYFKYGIYINVTPTNWHTVGNAATLIGSW
jgi:hypothetical protein